MNNKHPFQNEARQLSQLGQREDKILAHINPEEAQMLQEMFGADINPETGLPQFGLFRSLGRGIGRIFKNPMKAIGTVVGAMVGGPAGAAIGSTIGGQFGPKDRRSHIWSDIGNVIGGPIGTVVGSQFGPRDRRPGLGGTLANIGMNAMAHSMSGGGNNAGMINWGNMGKLGNIMGQANAYPGNMAGNIMQGLGNIFGGGGQTAGGAGGSGMGGLGNIFGGEAIMSNNFLPQGPGTMLPPGVGGGGMFGGMGGLGKFMLPLALVAGLNRKEKTGYQQSPEEVANRHLEIQKRIQSGMYPSLDYKPKKRKRKKDYYSYDEVASAGPSIDFIEDENEPKYKKGGFVKGGFIDGSYSGQADNIKKHIPNHSYIMNATDVSLLGDGNTKKGKKVLDKFVNKYEKGGSVVNMTDSFQFTPVLLSSGEYSIKPEVVKKIGDGSIKKGAKKLDKFRKNLRTHKGVAKILPPKTKELNYYFKGT